MNKFSWPLSALIYTCCDVTAIVNNEKTEVTTVENSYTS